MILKKEKAMKLSVFNAETPKVEVTSNVPSGHQTKEPVQPVRQVVEFQDAQDLGSEASPETKPTE